MPPTTSKEPRSCPCKLLPRSVSSFTAAEYGDTHSLSKIKDITSRKDDAGYNPLHFSAQFNHVAATALLLQLGCPVDGGGHCGATPLHRAAFSGATAAMKVLLEWNDPCGSTSLETNSEMSDDPTNTTPRHCDILARDTSFGDESTPLHKAAAGGRYLAVYMILEALKERDAVIVTRAADSIDEPPVASQKFPWLQHGLRAKDKHGRTPLDVAHHFLTIQDTERDAVARWDAVAGGPADWEKCVRLLENTTAKTAPEKRKEESKVVHEQAYSSNDCRMGDNNNRWGLPRLPAHLTKGAMACVDCNPSVNGNSNVCMTATWQSIFQKSLGDSASLCIVASAAASDGAFASNRTATKKTKIAPVTSRSREETCTSAEITDAKSVPKDRPAAPNENAVAVDSLCRRCKKPTVAFYPLLGAGTLVCKICHRLAKRNLRNDSIGS